MESDRLHGERGRGLTCSKGVSLALNPGFHGYMVCAPQTFVFISKTVDHYLVNEQYYSCASLNLLRKSGVKSVLAHNASTFSARGSFSTKIRIISII